MEKNLAESGSFAHIDDKKDEGETPRSPLPDSGETHAKEVEAKTDDEAKPPDAADTENDPAAVEKEGEDAQIQTPESPPPSLEKVSEDVDQYLETLSKNADVEEASLDQIPDFIDRFLELIQEKIAVYDSGGVKGKWGEVVEEDSLLLGALHRVSNLMKMLGQSQSSSWEEEINKRKDSLVNHIGALQHRAMSYFEEEFRFLLEESRNSAESDPGDHDPKGKQVEQDRNQSSDDQESIELEPEFPSYPDETIAKLKQIAEEMTSHGYQHECGQIYLVCRTSTIEEKLRKIGFEKMSIDEIMKMQWQILGGDIISTWLKTFKDCAGTVHLSGERKLAESVFGENSSLAVSLSSDLSRCIVIQLLNFAEAVAMSKRAMEKLFKTLDMYETLRDAIPVFEELLPEEVANELKTETSLTKSRLGENVISTFADLEIAIKTDAEKSLVAGGAVHPLTRYLMNYLPFACEYKDTLEQVFKEHSKIERADSTSRPRFEGEGNSANDNNNASTEHESPFVAQMIRLMSHLDTNLECKAKLYKDVSLSFIFMMNNGRYILQKIKRSKEMYSLMGETWCRKRSSDVRTNHKSYQRETWSKILSCLTPEGLTSHGKVQKPVLKERFKSFNALFDEIHKTQSMWIVNDEQLQSELRVSITAVVIPAYRAFLGRYSQYLDPGRQTEKYIKYQADDIENFIDELFDGLSPAKRRL